MDSASLVHHGGRFPSDQRRLRPTSGSKNECLASFSAAAATPSDQTGSQVQNLGPKRTAPA